VTPCNSNNGRGGGGGGGGVSIFSSLFTRTKNYLQRKRKIRTHHHLLFATRQEERFLENDNEYPPPLVITDLREFFESPSIATSIAIVSASDANETQQAQDIQAKEKKGENMVKYIEKVAQKI
jgi:hypothetical protein